MTKREADHQFHTHTGTPTEVETRMKLTNLWAEGIKKVLQEYGVRDKKIGFDYILDVSAVKTLEWAKIYYVDGQSVMMDARCVKRKMSCSSCVPQTRLPRRPFTRSSTP